MQRHQSWIVVVLIVLAGVVFTVTGVPFFAERGHLSIAVLVYAVLVVAAVYSRGSVRGGPLH